MKKAEYELVLAEPVGLEWADEGLWGDGDDQDERQTIWQGAAEKSLADSLRERYPNATVYILPACEFDSQERTIGAGRTVKRIREHCIQDSSPLFWIYADAAHDADWEVSRCFCDVDDGDQGDILPGFGPAPKYHPDLGCVENEN